MTRIVRLRSRLHSTCVRIAVVTLWLSSIVAGTAAADTWTAGTLAPHALAYHTATLLQDGRVLIVGVFGPPALFDPRSGGWTTTVNPPAETVNIGQPTAVLLRDGRVLVAGGQINGGAYVNAAHLFDPRTNGWTPAAAMNSIRVAMASVLLSDGRVFVSGGSNGSFPVADTEIYDPAANTWSPAASMLQTRAGHAMAPLPDGRILVVGPDTSEIYDPTANAMTTPRSMSTYRRNVAALLLPNGKVLAAGHNQPPGSSTAEEYDPATDSWSLTGPLNATVTGISLSLLPDGRVLLDGGPLSGSGPTSQIYDAALRVWTNGPDSIARAQHSATLLADGRVFVVGGLGSPVNQTPEIFDGQTTTSQSAAPVPGDRAQAVSVVLADGRVLVAGGNSVVTNTERADAAIYDPSADAWQSISSMSTPRTTDAKALLLRDGRALVIGGRFNNDPIAATDIYDPSPNIWQAGPPMNVARTESATVMLSNGWVLAIGGGTGPLGGALTASVEMYIPELNRWVPMAPMPAARRRLTAVRMADDRVLVAGGVLAGSGGALTDAWIFNYKANTWTPIAPLPVGREFPQSALLPDGRVILAGQTEPGGVVSTTTAIYDPATGLWTSVPLAGPPRYGYALVTLPSGEVATVGGRITAGDNAEEIAVFDPATMTWSVAGTSLVGRHYATAVALPDGRILNIGGVDASQTTLDTVETSTLTRGSDTARRPMLLGASIIHNGGAGQLLGSGFSGTFAGASSGFATSSATNYPLVRYRSLTTGEQGFVPIQKWSDGLVDSVASEGYSLGPAVFSIRTNGIGSVQTFGQVRSFPSTTTVAPVGNVTFSATDRTFPVSATVTGPIAGAQLGRVYFFVTDGAGTILGSLAVSSPVVVGDTASAVYALPGGVLPGTYTVSAVYTGDAVHVPSYGTSTVQVVPAPTMVTVTPHVTTVTRGGSVRVAATVTWSGGAVTNGALTLVNGADSCSFAAPGGSCDFTFPQLGTISVSGAYAPAPPSSYQASSAQASIEVTCPAITLTPGVLPAAHLNEPYSVQFQASGGLAPYTFSTGGTLPAGLTFSGDTLSGAPTMETNAAFTVQVTEAGGACGTSQSYTLATGGREYTLAEGASNGFFRSDISIANPNASDAPITLTYVRETGETATEARTLTPLSRLTIPTGAGSVAASIGSTFATRVTSEASLPLVVERATYFDGALHAGDLSSASEGGSTTWTFAEGANGYFHTYLTLGNLEDQPADVTVRYLPEAGAPLDRQYVVAPHSRQTIDTRTEPALAAGAFAMTVTSTRPIAADRVQYFGSPFIGAHADSGARAPSVDWYFAEGASGNAFDTYLLLGNPSTDAATVTVTWHTDALETVTKAYTVAGETRRSISVEVEDPRLAIGSFWMEVHSTRPIVAERAMYLIRNGAWTDATDTTGAAAPALRWGLAEGVAGPPLGYVPYLLIANPSSQPAAITVQYLLPTGAPLSQTYSVPALGRLTLDIRAETPALTGQQFGIIVSSTNGTPIVVERSLYWTLGTGGFVGAMNSMGTPLPPLP